MPTPPEVSRSLKQNDDVRHSTASYELMSNGSTGSKESMGYFRQGRQNSEQRSSSAPTKCRPGATKMVAPLDRPSSANRLILQHKKTDTHPLFWPDGHASTLRKAQEARIKQVRSPGELAVTVVSMHAPHRGGAAKAWGPDRQGLSLGALQRSASAPCGRGANKRGSQMSEMWEPVDDDSTTEASSSRTSGWSDSCDSCSSGISLTRDDTPELDALSRVLHPALPYMREPLFDFDTNFPKQARLPEDQPEALSALAERFMFSYQDLREGACRKLPLPLDVDPKLTMAAISLALYLVGYPRHGNPVQTDKHRGRPGSRGRRASRPQEAEALTFAAGPDTPLARFRAFKLLEVWRIFRSRTRQIHHSEEWMVRHTTSAVAELLTSKSTQVPARLERIATGSSTLFHMLTLSDEGKHGRASVLRSLGSKSANAAPGGRGEQARTNNTCKAPFQAAVELARTGLKIGLLVPASGFKIGGAFLVGRDRGLEEEACMRSTLFPMLLQHTCPDDGALLLSDVCVFRHGASEAYAPMKTEVDLSFLCMAFPNLAPRLSSQGHEIRGPPQGSMNNATYAFVLRPKIECALTLASKEGLEALVVSDEGLAELSNDEELFGRVLASVISTTSDVKLPKITLAGSSKFRGAVCQALGSVRASRGK